MSSRIDVSIEHRNVPEPPGKKHPNTCPRCDSHYRDDELDAALWVCPHCGHHFPMRARARIASLADEGTFVEQAADLRSEDPLDFFDLRPYTERLAEAEMKTGLGEAMVIGQAAVDGNACELAVMDFSFMGGSMGSVVGEKFSRACDSASQRGVPLLAFTGPRVVQQTTREKLPDDFGLAEQNLRFGHIDAIVPRPELKPYVARLLRLFTKNGN